MADLDWLIARPVAHRGFHDRAAGRLENTLAAAIAAVERGFAIECDLQLTADERVIVFHDDTLDRLTVATGPVHRLTLSELREIPLRDSEDRIPTLQELLETVGGKVPLVIELKSQFIGDRRLERRVAEALAGYAGHLAVMSFDPASMQAMRTLAPHLPRGMIADRFDNPRERERNPPLKRLALRHLLFAPLVRPQFVAYHVGSLPANAPLLLRHLGLKLLTWTVRTEADRETARRWADQMIFEGFDPGAA
jgi:glycerophosphoryl diester phosphodiesterase